MLAFLEIAPESRPNQLEEFFYAAYDLGLLDNKEYVFVVPSVYKDELHVVWALKFL